MSIHKLSPRKVETALPGKYKDGGGLRLVVLKTCSKNGYCDTPVTVSGGK